MRLTIAMLRAVLALPAPAALAAQTGQFVVRLGRDTLAIEQYTRTADRLQGEEVARSARAAGRDRYTMSMLVLGDTEPMPVTVTRDGSDSLTMMLDGIGPLRVRLDGQGRLLGVSGIGGTAQITVERVQGLDFAR